MYQAVSYYRLPNPYAVRSGVRKDILNIDRLIDEVKYIRDNALTSKNAIEEREARLESQIEVLTRKNGTLKIHRKACRMSRSDCLIERENLKMNCRKILMMINLKNFRMSWKRL